MKISKISHDQPGHVTIMKQGKKYLILYLNQIGPYTLGDKTVWKHSRNGWKTKVLIPVIGTGSNN